jgi:uncharacterized protein YndB with AHSA1/START domain
MVSLLLWSGAKGAEQATSVSVTQHKGVAEDRTRFYEDSLVINAPVTKLWKAFTDAAEYRRWSVPVAAIDFRLGGILEASYDANGHLGDPDNIKNELIAYIPQHLLVYRNVQAPNVLPGKDEYAKTVKTIEFTEVGVNQTKVTVSGVGFGEGKDFDDLYAFFATGDGAMLISLKKAVE